MPAFLSPFLIAHHSLTLTFTLSVALSASFIYMAVNLATSSSEAAYLTASVQTLTEDISQFQSKVLKQDSNWPNNDQVVKSRTMDSGQRIKSHCSKWLPHYNHKCGDKSEKGDKESRQEKQNKRILCSRFGLRPFRQGPICYILQ